MRMSMTVHQLTDRQTPVATARILVVDDEPMPRLLTGRSLEASGFEVHYAKNGREALERYTSVLPDVVVLDVMMPELDGYEVCRRIRSGPDGARPAILMMTALDDAASIDRAYAVQATDFVVKPINPRLMPHRVRYLHRSSQAAAELRESEMRLKSAERIANVGHWVWSIDEDDVVVSEQAAAILGINEPGPSLASLFERVPSDERERLRVCIARSADKGEGFIFEHRIVGDGQMRHASQRAVVERSDDGSLARVVATVHDITQRRRDEEEIRRLAYFDSLTGLANRVLLRQNLDRVLDLARRHNRNSAVLCLDLDLFKRVNDTLGHSAGDDLLKAAANRLQTAMRRSDCVAVSQPPQIEHLGSSIGRVGGDEFTIVLSEIRREEDAAIVAKRLLGELAKPFTVGREQVFVGASIGIAVYPCDGDNAEDLTKNADAALYHAKAQGRNRFAFYSESLNEATRRRMQLETGMRIALQEDQFEVVYQPKVEIGTDRVFGLEALLRWHHPEEGTISPGIFIPVAEDTGLIIPIGTWVLRTACDQLRRWSDQGLTGMSISVNVAARQFSDEDFVSIVTETLAASGIESSQLELEITESTLMDDTDVSIDVLNALRALGVRVAVDDFGTGYSSLSYLRKFPIDVLKVDRSFVQDIPHNSDNSAIAEAIIAMGDSLRMKVVAEGVETDAQLAFLANCNCDAVQGFLFSRPLPADAMGDWMQQRVRNDDG